MTKEEFWTQKSSQPELWTITFYHVEFGYIRLVANQFTDITIGGNVYQACAMQIQPPSQTKEPDPTLSVSFSRIHVGRQFKQALSQITIGGRLTPISVNFSRWIQGVAAESFDLFVADDSGISFNTDGVQVKAVDDNSLRYDVSRIYNIEEYSGLAQI